MGRVVSPTPTPLSSGRVVPALVASYDMHGRAVGLFYTQPTGHVVFTTLMILIIFISIGGIAATASISVEVIVDVVLVAAVVAAGAAAQQQ